jgi:hypothetical protein
MNLLFSFVIAQCFLTMLCSLQWATFLFFAICVVCMTTFVYFFYIETKGVPIEETPFIFRGHWWWKRNANLGLGLQEELVLDRKLKEAAERGEEIQDANMRRAAKDMQADRKAAALDGNGGSDRVAPFGVDGQPGAKGAGGKGSKL